MGGGALASVFVDDQAVAHKPASGQLKGSQGNPQQVTKPFVGQAEFSAAESDA